MPCRSLLAVLLLPAVAACRSGPELPSAGRLVLEHDGREFVDTPASAVRCPRDSVLAVAVTTPEWSAAFSVRSAWPVDTPTAVPVGQILGPGTAVVAARPLRDSIRAALVSVRGSVAIDPGTVLSGRLDVAAVAATSPDTVRLTGRFTGITVTDDLCPGPDSQ